MQLTEPTKLRLIGFCREELEPLLKYTDKSVDYALNKARNNRFLRRNLGEQKFAAHIAELQAQRECSLLREDSKGFWTYPGVGPRLAKEFGLRVESKVVYPDEKLIPWDKKPFDQRPYQVEAVGNLTAAKHAAVSLATGTGKSRCILQLAKEHGLKTVIVTPSVSIANQLYDDFKLAFGPKYVGKFFGGQKQAKKRFVVAVDDSLTRVEEDTADWKLLRDTDVVIWDESHTSASTTLEKVCHGLLAHAPYRYFFSATQIRNDGKDLLLEGIIGPIVAELGVQDAVEQGWLSKPMFRIVTVGTDSDKNPTDPNEATREHLLYNAQVLRKAANIANLMVEKLNRPTVILIREVAQFGFLLPLLKHKVGFAHGGSTDAKAKDSIPEEYRKSDPKELVRQFNDGELPILIGTSCITTGTDIRPVKCILFLRGGKSEIDVKQSIGRGTRRPPGKEDFFFVDFDVPSNDVVTRHAQVRRDIYREVYPDVEDVNL